MAFIKEIQTPDNIKHQIKNTIIPVIGTQTSSTSSWTGNIDLPSLYDGLTIAYFLPYNSVSGTSVNLKLTLNDGSQTDPIACYISSGRLGTQYTKGSNIIMTYWSKGSINIDGTITTNNRWIAHADYNTDVDTNTWRNIQVNGTEKLGTGIDTGALNFIDGTNTTVSYDSGVKIDATDEKVKQIDSTTNAAYRILFSNSANDNTETNQVKKSSNFLFNPSTGSLTLIGVQSIKSTNIDRDSGTTPASQVSGDGYYNLTDKDGEVVGRIRAYQNTDGGTTVGLYAYTEVTGSTSATNNYILITRNKDGTNSYAVSSPTAFRTAIGAGTSDLVIGTTSTTAMAGNTTFPTTIATDSGTNQLTLTASTKYKLTAGGTSYIFTTPPNTNTTYSLSRDGDNVKLTPSSGTATTAGAANLQSLTNEDLNTITTPGFYYAGGSNTCTNKPSGINAFGLMVMHTAAGSYYYQFLNQNGQSRTFRRICSNDTWGDWVEEKITDTTYSAGTGLSLSGTTFNHSNSVTAGTAKGDDSKTLTFDGTFTIPTVTYDAQGHITGKGTTTMTMPSNPNTDEKVKLTLLETDVEKQYYVPFKAASTSIVYGNSGFIYYTKDGTTTVDGYGVLRLGNSTASGTEGNRFGQLRIYSKSTSYCKLIQADVTSYVTHTLPATGGTILNTGTTSFTRTLTSGTEIGTIKINGTDTILYCKSGTVTSVAVSNDTNGGLTISGSPITTSGTIKIKHTNQITAGTASGSSTKTLTFGGTFTIPTVTYDANGHITEKGTTTMTMPSNPNTDKKVDQNNSTSQSYRSLLLGPTTSSTTYDTTSQNDVTYRNVNLRFNPSGARLIIGSAEIENVNTSGTQGVLTLYDGNNHYCSLKQPQITGNITHTLPTTGSELVNLNATQTLTNKTLEDCFFFKTKNTSSDLQHPDILLTEEFVNTDKYSFRLNMTSGQINYQWTRYNRNTNTKKIRDIISIGSNGNITITNDTNTTTPSAEGRKLILGSGSITVSNASGTATTSIVEDYLTSGTISATTTTSTSINVKNFSSTSGDISVQSSLTFANGKNIQMADAIAMQVNKVNNVSQFSLGISTLKLVLYGSSYYLATGSAITSDKRLKTNIEIMDNRYLNLIKDLEPKRFKLKNNPSQKYHTGFIAQDVQELLKKYNINEEEFAAFARPKEDDSEYALSYTEFIPLLLLYIKDLEKQIKEIKEQD